MVLAAAFALAAAAKVLDRAGSTRAMRDFGIPLPLTGVVAGALPIAEIGTCLALLYAPAVWWGAVGALVLLLAFSVAIVWNLARGKRPDCHCFGSLDGGPIGARTLVRNGVLIGLATTIALQGPHAGHGSPTQVVVVGAVLAVIAIIIGEAYVAGRLLCNNNRLLGQITDLTREVREHRAATSTRLSDSSATVPRFVLPNAAGGTRGLDEYLHGSTSTLLVFVGPDCWFCRSLAPDLIEWQHRHPGKLTLVFVSGGAEAASREAFSAVPPENLLFDAEGDVWRLLDVRGHPSALPVGPDGTHTHTWAHGADQIVDLVERQTGTTVDRRHGRSRVQRLRSVVVQQVCA